MVNAGIVGETFGVEIDMDNGTVKISGEVFTHDKREAYIFNLAYRMGRDHKKTQIRKALGM